MYGEGWRGGMTRTQKLIGTVALVLLAAAMLTCSELNKQSAPVAVVVTNTQLLHKIDLAGGTGCDQDIATILMQAVLLQNPNVTNLPTDTRFDDVKIDRYRVSYVRTDGGNLVPSPFVRSISALLPVGAGTTNLTSFLAFEPASLTQAPFAALLPQNGGRDPETGRSDITMDIILEVFGQTLAGESVAGSTRLTLDFCVSCGGCS
jgi:hypothetical protein